MHFCQRAIAGYGVQRCMFQRGMISRTYTGGRLTESNCSLWLSTNRLQVGCRCLRHFSAHVAGYVRTRVHSGLHTATIHMQRCVPIVVRHWCVALSTDGRNVKPYASRFIIPR